MRINYNHLRYFYFVAHEGHLTRAAGKLHISQSALSVQIKTLENDLGHQLFTRQGRSLQLTEVGRLVLEHADGIFRSGEELLYQLAHHRELSRRLFRVAAVTTLSRNFQIEFLGPLLSRPDTELVVSSASLADLLAQLESHRIDAALTNTAPTREAGTPWVSHLISKQPVGLIGPADFKDDGRPLKDLLSREPLFIPSPDSNIRLAFDALIERMGIAVDIKAEVNDMTMLRLFAREAKGLAIVPPIVVRDELEQGILREIREFPEIQESFYAVVLKRRFPNPLLDVLLKKDGKKKDGK